MPEGDAVGVGEHSGLGQEELGPGVSEKIDRPKRNTDLDDKVVEVYKLLRRCIAQPERKAWIAKRRECWDAVYEAKIWDEEDIKAMKAKKMIPLAVNDLYQGVRGSSAIVTDQHPGIQFIPVGSGDLYVAELMERAHEQVWAQNCGLTEIFELVKEVKIAGLGCMDAKQDPSKGIFGKQVLGAFDPETLYFDMKKAKKPDLSDVDIIKAHLITKSQAKETYEGLADEDFQFSGPDLNEIPSKVEDTKTGEDNYAESGKDGKGQPQSPEKSGDEEKEDVWEIEAHLLKKEKEYWLMTPMEGGGFQRKIFSKSQKKEAEEAKGKTPNSVLWPRLVEKRVMRIIVGKKLISEEVNPLGIDSDGDPVLPVNILLPERTRKGKPVSPTVFAKEACRERNKRRTQAIYVTSKNLDAPIVVGSGYKWERDEVHGDVLHVDKDAPFPPTRLVPGTVSTEAMNLERVAKEDVNDFYDMQDVMRGKLPPGDPSGRTVLALQDTSGTMTKPFVRSLEAFLERQGKIDMALILKYWPRQKWERLIEPEEMETWEPKDKKKNVSPAEVLNPNPQEPNRDLIRQKWTNALELIRPADAGKEPGISLIDVDVRVVAGSTMPTNRMARQAVAMDMVKAQIYDAEAALDYIDDPKKDEISARMKVKEQAMMAAGAAQGAS